MIPFAPQALVLALAIAGAFYSGHRTAANSAAAKAAKAEAVAAAIYKQKEGELHELSAQYEELREKRAEAARTITRTVTKIVERPSYQRECFDDDGVRAAQRALSGSPDPGEPYDKVQPTPKP